MTTIQEFGELIGRAASPRVIERFLPGLYVPENACHFDALWVNADGDATEMHFESGPGSTMDGVPMRFGPYVRVLVESE